MRSLAYFIPLLLERANSKPLDNKVEKLEVDFKVMSKVKKLIAADVSYKELVEELNEQFEIVKKTLIESRIDLSTECLLMYLIHLIRLIKLKMISTMSLRKLIRKLISFGVKLVNF